MNTLLNVDGVNRLIKNNRILVLAGDEKLLAQLEKGNWIGGTIPYFMGDEGGCMTKEKIFVSDFTDYMSDNKIVLYDEKNIHDIVSDQFESGFPILLFLVSAMYIKICHGCQRYTGHIQQPCFGLDLGNTFKRYR
ncbi:MAG: hypothetical protein HC906_00165 [Bacteroidales bacterium]|nr:hypothetical protein [Bacteroidales bacterium]